MFADDGGGSSNNRKQFLAAKDWLSDSPAPVTVAPDPGGSEGGEDDGHAHDQAPPHASNAFLHGIRGEPVIKSSFWKI
jgi:hypothetical protein